MAGIYTPTTTFYPNGVYTISSNDATPYFVIQNSMGSYLYGIFYIYLQSNTPQQLLQGMNFRTYDVNGEIKSFINTTTIDPYQYQNALFVKPISDDIVLNGRTSINFNLLPTETVNFVFYVNQTANSYLLKEPSFFDDYFFKQQYDYLNGFVEEI
jgi:hypothetical protein